MRGLKMEYKILLTDGDSFKANGEDIKIFVDGRMLSWDNIIQIEKKDTRIKYKAPYELRKEPGDIGYDIRATEDVYINARETKLVPTGLYLELDDLYYADLRPRSGNTSKGLICHLGLIDTNYRGEVKACITNMTGAIYKVNKGDRIAQLVFREEEVLSLDKVSDIDVETNRGDKGFGSSGK